jgi:hypothetical protein
MQARTQTDILALGRLWNALPPRPEEQPTLTAEEPVTSASVMAEATGGASATRRPSYAPEWEAPCLKRHRRALEAAIMQATTNDDILVLGKLLKALPPSPEEQPTSTAEEPVTSASLMAEETGGTSANAQSAEELATFGETLDTSGDAEDTRPAAEDTGPWSADGWSAWEDARPGAEQHEQWDTSAWSGWHGWG